MKILLAGTILILVGAMAAAQEPAAPPVEGERKVVRIHVDPDARIKLDGKITAA